MNTAERDFVTHVRRKAILKKCHAVLSTVLAAVEIRFPPEKIADLK